MSGVGRRSPFSRYLRFRAADDAVGEHNGKVMPGHPLCEAALSRHRRAMYARLTGIFLPAHAHWHSQGSGWQNA
jgi:hypothetical protein